MLLPLVVVRIPKIPVIVALASLPIPVLQVLLCSFCFFHLGLVIIWVLLTASINPLYIWLLIFMFSCRKRVAHLLPGNQSITCTDMTVTDNPIGQNLFHFEAQRCLCCACPLVEPPLVKSLQRNTPLLHVSYLQSGFIRKYLIRYSHKHKKF